MKPSKNIKNSNFYIFMNFRFIFTWILIEIYSFINYYNKSKFYILNTQKLKMINFFLSNQPEIQPKTKSIIKNHLCKKRKYQPFHIDCDITKKKICYCVKNPVLNI